MTTFQRVLISVGVVSVLGLGGALLLFLLPHERETDFESLRVLCGDNRCCLTSVQLMEENGNRLAPRQDLYDHQCGEGFEAGALNCSGSYVWCYPQGREF